MCPWCLKWETLPKQEPLNTYLAELGYKLGNPERAWHSWCLKIYLKIQGVTFHEDEKSEQNF